MMLLCERVFSELTQMEAYSVLEHEEKCECRTVGLGRKWYLGLGHGNRD